MTIFRNARCPVSSCPANRGEAGCTCDYAYRGVACRHPVYKAAWAAAHELEQAQAEQEQKTLTARALAANRPMGAARARQLALSLEVGA